MRKMVVTLFAVLALCQAGAADLPWLTDLAKAEAKAKAENKLVMMDFTGSDWCPWCIKLDKEVFSTPEFVKYAEKNLVPMLVDFPRKKQQSAELKRANQQLEKKYKIEGYPTVIVLNKDGTKVGELGYQPGGPKRFIAQLEKLRSKS
ncbi:MAG TPA: thioredoxin family protein [Verrucomicrobiae bacterium]